MTTIEIIITMVLMIAAVVAIFGLAATFTSKSNIKRDKPPLIPTPSQKNNIRRVYQYPGKEDIYVFWLLTKSIEFAYEELVYRLRQTIQMAPSTTILGAEQFYQTIKGSGNITRLEAEIELMKPQFHELWHLCKNDTVHKNRYAVKLTEGKKYKDSYLDVYKHDFEGLFTFEVEFNTEKESKDFVPEPWFYREISKLDEYKNFNLAIAKKLPDDFLNDKSLTK